VIKQQRHAELANYFAGRWSGTAKPYTETLKKCMQRPQFFPGEDAAERNVPTRELLAGRRHLEERLEERLVARVAPRSPGFRPVPARDQEHERTLNAVAYFPELEAHFP